MTQTRQGAGDSMGTVRTGDQVVVRDRVSCGTPRTPTYLRGRVGTVVFCHGIVDNPLDHHTPYPPLYSVVFPVDPLDAGNGEEVLAEIHEDWLALPDPDSNTAS